MTGWELSLGFYKGILFGVCSEQFKDGNKHCLYLPLIFFQIDTYYA